MPMLHFAYGSNMSRAVMRKHAPAALPLGVAAFLGHRFVITADGYASAQPARGVTVFGVLWRLTPRDYVRLDRWESVAGGQYRAEVMPVVHAGSRRFALIYLARPRPAGNPKAGYIEIVVAAARAWGLPRSYIASLECWLPNHPRGAGPRRLGDVGWT